MVLNDCLKAQVVSNPHKTAVSTSTHSLSYAQLDEQVEKTAVLLSQWGVQPGKAVAVLLPNSLEYFVIIHALARLRAVIVPLNNRLTPAEWQWQLEQVHCCGLISSGDVLNHGYQLSVVSCQLPVVSCQLPVVSCQLPVVSCQLPVVSYWPFAHSDQLTTNGDLAALALVFTSGTTGKPKAAVLTAENFLWGAMSSAYRLGVLPQDRWLLCMPLYHVGGLAVVWRCCLYGITAVLHDHFDPQAVNHALDEQGVTLVSLVPTMLQRVLQTRQERPFPPSLRCVLLGGAAASQSLLTHCHQWGVPVALTYGLTEATSQVTTAVPTDVWRKPGSVGKPLLFSAVKIVNETGDTLPANQIGEICVTGATVMSGYYQQPAATEKVLQQGWLYTGDMGYLDEEGDLWVVQRRSDLIVTGGENVYPMEVEEVLRANTAVQEVCVVGIPDETWGQKVAAAIVLNPHHPTNEADIITFCRQHLAGYKQPRLIRFVPQLPQTASGKIHRQAVSELFQSDFT